MRKTEHSNIQKTSNEHRQRCGWYCPTWIILTTFTSQVCHLIDLIIFTDRKRLREESELPKVTQWITCRNRSTTFISCISAHHSIQLFSYLACGFRNTGPVSLPANLSSTSYPLGIETSLKCTMLGSGGAVLLPAKGKFYVSEECFGCWLVGNDLQYLFSW